MIQPKSCTMIFIDPEYVIKRYGRYYHFLRLIYFSTSFKLIIGNDSSFFFLFTTLLKHFFFFFSFLQKRRYRQSKFTLRRCIRWIFPPNICAYPFCTYAAVSEIRPVNSGNVDKKWDASETVTVKVTVKVGHKNSRKGKSYCGVTGVNIREKETDEVFRGNGIRWL